MEKVPIQKIAVLKITDIDRISEETKKIICKHEKNALNFQRHYLLCIDDYYLVILLFWDPKQKAHISINHSNYKIKVLNGLSPFKLADNLNKLTAEMLDMNYFLTDLQFQKNCSDEFIITAIYEYCNLFYRAK